MDTVSIQMLPEKVQGIIDDAPLCTNNCLILILLVCFFVLSAVLSDKDNFLGNMLKGFFLPRESSEDAPNTIRRLYMRIGMLSVLCISLALLLSVYVTQMTGNTSPNLQMTLQFSAFLIGLYIIKQSLFWVVNMTFFDRHRAVLWHNCYINWLALSSIPAFLFALFVVFIDSNPDTTTWLALTMLFFTEIGLFFRAFHIFFGKRYGVLHLFVYLCTLELMPLLFLGKALVLYV